MIADQEKAGIHHGARGDAEKNRKRQVRQVIYGNLYKTAQPGFILKS
jgi:hypothetical protein